MAPTTSWVLSDRYDVGPLLGRGAMGDVRAATDRVLGREVAVKLLRTELRHDPAAHDRFIAEARAAAALAHPNVVAVHDAGEDDGDTYLVMERLSGRTLADDVARGPLDPQRACDVVLDVLAGLEAAHSAGIVHRDVKPGNVMWSDDGRVKVGDFGIATSAASEMTRTDEVVGTPAYLAPERIVGERATPRSDVFAVGVLLYHCLTGATPFPGDTPIAVAFAITQNRVRPLREVAPQLPAALVAVVERAMAHEPDDRYPSAHSMASELARVRTDIDDVDVVTPPGALVGVASGATPTVALDAVDSREHDATVAVALAGVGDDHTTVLPVADPVAPPATGPSRRRSGALVALAAGIVLVAGLTWGLSRDDSTPPRTEPTSDTVATTPAPTSDTVATTLAPTTTVAPAAAPLSPAPAVDDDDGDDDGDSDDDDDDDGDGDEGDRGAPGGGRGNGKANGRD